MTYIIETYHPYELGRFDAARFASLAEARAEAQRRVGQRDAAYCGACPDEDEESLIGIECWMPYLDDDFVPDGTVFVYRRGEG